MRKPMGMAGIVILGLMAGCQARGVEKGGPDGGAKQVEKESPNGPSKPSGEVSGKPVAKPTVRHPAVAGGFYPADPAALRNMVAGFLANVPDTDPGGRIVAAMAPHAGYVYSGQVAAYTHKLLQNVDFDTVVIIGHDAFRGAIAYLCSVDYFETPLGRVPVDREMVSSLEAFHSGIVDSCAIQARDHTVEVQLPFFQLTRKAFKIVPVMFGNPTLENAQTFAEAIRKSAGDRKVFVLASTDMSNYPPYDAARKLDGKTLDVLQMFDPSRLFKHLRAAESSGKVPGLRTAMCASGGVLTALNFARAAGADKVKVLKYANAGDVPRGDKNRVVGYGAAVFVKSGSSGG